VSETGSTPQSTDGTWSPSEVHSRATAARQLVLRSYERSALTIDEYAEIVIAYAESPEETVRRRLTRRRLDVLRDAWGPLLKASFEGWTTPAVQDAVLGPGRDHLDLSRNPAKRIWHDLSVLYTSPAERSTAPAANGEAYNKILRRTGFDVFWPVVEELAQACNEVLVWPDVITVGGRKIPRHRYATGDVFSIVATDRDPCIIEAVVIHDEWRDTAGQKWKQWKIWTEDWHAVYERDTDTGMLRRADVVEDGAADNPFGMLPQHLIRIKPWQDTILDATSGEDIVDGTLYGGESQQFIRYHQKMSGFKQAAVTGADLDEMPQQMLDPGAVFRIQGVDASLTIVDWQLNLKAAQDVMDADELRLAASVGINPEKYKRTASYQSGFGARLSERPLELLRASMVPVFDEAEAAYYRAACKVWAAHGIEGAPDPDAEFRVKHAPYQFPEDPGAQLDLEAKELALFQADYVELVKRRRPELTDAQALELIRTRGVNIEEVQRMKVAHNVPGNMMNESADAEANGAMGPVVRDASRPGSQPGEANSEE